MFVGPNKHFSIVIDEFDGKIVKAWHIENSKGEKSPNLATRAGGKHIDLVVGKACRSTAHAPTPPYARRAATVAAKYRISSMA